jgi:hypothetical protein
MSNILLIVGTSMITYEVIRLYDGYIQSKRDQFILEKMKESIIELKVALSECKGEINND